ncbi:ATP-binding protein [Saccharothrix sp. BKS2]|uniref:ATP-binding protein n=1 Tax=Saccharothrix sp. BKS2 TaxID=3064400 RepID=UPI0039E7CB5C
MTDEGDRSPPAPLVVDLTGPRPPALADVRRRTVASLPALSDDKVDDVLLVVTELVSNAYDHGDRALELRVGGSRQLVRIEVDDESPDMPVLGRSSIGRYRGHGLLMVENLCKDWGVARGTAHKTVWAVLTSD